MGEVGSRIGCGGQCAVVLIVVRGGVVTGEQGEVEGRWPWVGEDTSRILAGRAVAVIVVGDGRSTGVGQGRG